MLGDIFEAWCTQRWAIEEDNIIIIAVILLLNIPVEPYNRSARKFLYTWSRTGMEGGKWRKREGEEE